MIRSGSGRRTALTMSTRAGAGLVLRDLVVDQRHFHQLPADQHGRIERGHRLLIDHGDLRAADGAQLRAPTSVAMSRPSKRIAPLVIRPTPGRSRMMASATVDLPQPDSPTSPIASPGHDLAGEVHDRRDFAAAGEERNAEVVDLEDGIGHARLHQSRSDCSRIASASRFRPSTNDIIASAGGRAGWT